MEFTKNEIIFYNALETSASVVKVLNDDTLLPKLTPISTNLTQIGSNSFIPITTSIYQKVTNW